MTKAKSPYINVGGQSWLRIPLKTSILSADDEIAQVIRQYALPYLEEGDIVTIS